MSILRNILSAPARMIAAVALAVALKNPAIKAKYDAAQSSPDSRRHWANADGLSANLAANPEVRAILRNRMRYEDENNGYVKGIAKTHCNFCIGTGPRLQMQSGNVEVDRFIESEFHGWAKKIRLAKKLRLMRRTKMISGEAFAMLVTNAKLNHRVQLDLRIIEADRVREDYTAVNDPLEVDGIRYDTDGNPVSYKVMKTHPGGSTFTYGSDGFNTIKAEDMLHLYEWDRPEQSRGVPELSASLPIFANLRRLTLATVLAAETAANHAGVMETTSTANIEPADIPPNQTQEIERNMLTALPEGWKLSQMKAEQPTTMYPDFKHECIDEAARPLNMPSNIARCNSSNYNYASGRLDHQTYFKSIDVERDDIEIEALDPTLEKWFAEAVLISGYLPQAARTTAFVLKHEWFWDGVGHVDPVKDASAQETRLKNHTTTLADEYAKDGWDWETKLRQIAKERALMKELGIPETGGAPGIAPDEEADGEEVDPDAIDAAEMEPEVRINALGVAVRAGVVTPQTADEESMRATLGLPKMSDSVRKAWTDDGGVRRPITLTPEGGTPPPAAPADIEEEVASEA